MAAAEVLRAHDIRVFFGDRAVPTQMSSFEVVERGAAAGIVITASHNPWVDNGFKVKAPTGAAAGADTGPAGMAGVLDAVAVRRRCGLAIAVPNARKEVKAAAHYVTRHGGGTGAVRDAVEFMLAGATAVGVGTALFLDPTTPLAVITGIEDYLRRHAMSSVAQLIGRLTSRAIGRAALAATVKAQIEGRKRAARTKS